MDILGFVDRATNGPGTFSDSNVTVPAGNATFSASVTIDTALAASETPFINPLSVTWSVAQAGTSCTNPTFACVAAGASSNPVYVTLATSVFPATGFGPTMLTYFYLAVGTGGATSQSAALANTWALFSTGTGPANVKTWDTARTTSMSYYTAGFGSCATTAQSVVQNLPTPSAQCGAFAYLLESALAVNGIHSSWIKINAADKTTSPNGPSKMVINNWQLAETPTYSSSPWFYRFVVNPGSDCMVPTPSTFGDLTNLVGEPGQGDPSSVTPPALANTPDEKVFDFHYVARIGCTLSANANAQIPCVVPPNPPAACSVYGSGTGFMTRRTASCINRKPTLRRSPSLATLNRLAATRPRQRWRSTTYGLRLPERQTFASTKSLGIRCKCLGRED